MLDSVCIIFLLLWLKVGGRVRQRSRADLTLFVVASVRWLLFRWSSGSQDLIGCAENLLCALFRDRVGVVSDSLVQPMLNVAARVVRSFEVQCFAAQQSD